MNENESEVEKIELAVAKLIPTTASHLIQYAGCIHEKMKS